MLLLLVSRSLIFAFVALNLKSTVWRATAFSFVLSLALADIASTQTEKAPLTNASGVVLGFVVLEGLRYLLLTRPLEEFRHESDKVPAYQLPYMQRFFWLMSISPRGIGWSFKDFRPVPVDPHHCTRGAFIISRLRTIFACFWLMQAASLYMHSNPVFSTGASIASQGYILRCVNIIATYSGFYGFIYCYCSLLAVVAVAINHSEPQAWPHPFGHWKDAYTIRRFWGRTWHQNCRYIFTAFGPHRYNRRPWDELPSADPSPRNPKDSWSRSYIRICNAFVCSALFHVCVDVAVQFRLWQKYSSMGMLSSGKGYAPFVIGVSASFYLLQPLGVLVEDAVMEVGKRLGVKAGLTTKLIGYVWVWVWVSFTLVPSFDGLRTAIHTAFPEFELGSGTTVIERIVSTVFGVDLMSVISPYIVS